MAVQKRTAMCKMNNSQEGTFTCPSGNSFICTCNTIFCKHYFKMCCISIPYTCQETTYNFLFTCVTQPFFHCFYVYFQSKGNLLNRHMKFCKSNSGIFFCSIDTIVKTIIKSISYTGLIFCFSEFSFFLFFIVLEYTHRDHLRFICTKKFRKNVITDTFIDCQFNCFVQF